MSPTSQIGQIDGRAVVDRAGIRVLIGKSASAVDRYVATTEAPIPEPATTVPDAAPPLPLPPFPAKAGILTRQDTGREVDVWYADQVTAWWQRYDRARAARRTLADRSGDPEELVDLEEAAIVCGYDDARSITALLKMPYSRFPQPDHVEEAGQRPRLFYRRRTLWDYCNQRGARGRPRGTSPYDPVTVQAGIEHLRQAVEQQPRVTVTADTLAQVLELETDDRHVRKGYLIRASRVVIPDKRLITRAEIAARIDPQDPERARTRVLKLMQRPDAPTPVLQDRRILYYHPDDIPAFLTTTAR